jgi:uncharacterized protein (TIGR03435 family)
VLSFAAWPLLAQVGPPHEFEVASVKPNRSSGNYYLTFGHGRVETRDASLATRVLAAYSTEDHSREIYEIKAPAWVTLKIRYLRKKFN